MLRRLLRIVLIPLLMAGLGYGSQALAMFAFDQFANYRGPAMGSLPAGRPTAPISQRVVVVVVDGLREDTSHQMPAFQRLRQQGADLPAWTGLPSLSLPGYTTLGTGAYPGFSTVTSNWYSGPVPVDSLFARAKDAGLPTALVAMAGWDSLYAPWVTWSYTVTWPEGVQGIQAGAMTTEEIGQEAGRMLGESDVALLYVHFGETDAAGEAHGGTSPEYMEAALHVDAQIEVIAGRLDWSRDTLVLTADHGMIAWRGRGGHGGGEAVARRTPLVMVGRGIVPGTYAEGGQVDLVPTVAALLGLPIPAHSQGHTRLELLVLTPEQRAEKALALGAQQQDLYLAYLRALGARTDVGDLKEANAALAAGAYDQVEGKVREFLGRLDDAVSRAEANRLWRERAVRLPYLLLPPLAGGLFLGLYRPRRALGRPLLLALLFFALYVALYAGVRGYTLSFSTIGNADYDTFFLARTVDALLAMLVVAVAAGILWRRKPWEDVVWGANLGTLSIAWLFLLQVGLYLWLFGLLVTWQLPQLGWGFKFYLDLLAATGVGFAGFLFPWLALGVSRLFILGDWVRNHWGRRRYRSA